MKALGPRRRPIAWAIFLIVQTLATVFFVGDAAADYLAGQISAHLVFEMLVALATARGALADVIAAQFTDWGLTPAERDVGFLALKGLDVAEIAELRGRAAGTVRAQLTRIYSKAGVSGRAQFAAYFVEDLLGEGLEGL